MSTCQGAPAPHLNCPHGERCDWVEDAMSTACGFCTNGVFVKRGRAMECPYCGGTGRTA